MKKLDMISTIRKLEVENLFEYPEEFVRVYTYIICTVYFSVIGYCTADSARLCPLHICVDLIFGLKESSVPSSRISSHENF